MKGGFMCVYQYTGVDYRDYISFYCFYFPVILDDIFAPFGI